MSRRPAPRRVEPAVLRPGEVERRPIAAAVDGVVTGRPLSRFQVLRRKLDRRRLVQLAIGSLLLHLMLLLLFLAAPQDAPPPPPGEAPGEISLAFETGNNGEAPPQPKPTAPAPATQAAPKATPAPQAALPSPPTPTVPPDPTAAEPPPPPLPTPPIPPPPVPLPQAPLAHPPIPPEVRTETPPDAEAALPLPPPVPLPPAPKLPAAAPPPQPRPPQPRPPPPHPAPRAPPPGAFPAPMDLTFGGSLLNAHPHNAPAPRHGLDLALGPASRGGGRAGSAEQFDDLRGDHLSPDWRAELREWWEQHRYYPQQAVMNGEDGDVDVRITTTREGHVQKVELMSRSGSQWLDLGAQAIFRDAHLPPFTPDMTDAQTVFTLTIHYVLIRR